MKKTISIIALLLAFLGTVQAQSEKMRFMLQWAPQAQFAGVYMADEKGFFAEEGLDVEILHPSTQSSKGPYDYMMSGEADIIMLQLAQALSLNTVHVPLVSVLQVTQNSALLCVSREPVSSLKDLDGKRVGRWKSSIAQLADMACDELNVNIDWIYFIKSINLFMSGAIDATLCYSYSELNELLFSLGSIPEENIINFADISDVFNMPEDGIFVAKKYLDEHGDAIDAFVRAVKKGWLYARDNREETLDVVMRIVEDNNIITSRIKQKMMLDEMLRLQVNPDTGEPDFAPVSPEKFVHLSEYLIRTGSLVEPVSYKNFIR